MIGTIEKVTRKEKSSIVRVDGDDFFIKGDIDISSMEVGRKLDFSFAPRVYNNKNYKWIQHWAVLPRDNGVHAAAPTPAPPPPSPNAGFVSPSPHAAEAGPYIRAEHLACVSNFLAHAVNSALITKPEDLAKWVYALRDALEHQEAPF